MIDHPEDCSEPWSWVLTTGKERVLRVTTQKIAWSWLLLTWYLEGKKSLSNSANLFNRRPILPWQMSQYPRMREFNIWLKSSLARLELRVHVVGTHGPTTSNYIPASKPVKSPEAHLPPLVARRRNWRNEIIGGESTICLCPSPLQNPSAFGSGEVWINVPIDIELASNPFACLAGGTDDGIWLEGLLSSRSLTNHCHVSGCLFPALLQNKFYKLFDSVTCYIGWEIQGSSS